MPFLKRTIIQDFRNISLQELEFCGKLNCICGGNGEGKTNLLDAVWYLSMTKSAFSVSDRFNFRHGTDSFGISGTYGLENGLGTRISVQVDRDGSKKLKRDDRLYVRISDHIGLLPIVMVSPADSALVTDTGDERRKFVNAVLSQTDAEYLSSVQAYNTLLAQRNRLLKDSPDEDALLDILDERLDATARPIFEKRNRFTGGLVPVVRKYYEMISGASEDVDIEYRSDLLKGELLQTLHDSRQKDRLLKFTSAGIQRDDFIFTMDGFPIRKCGSQGQQKSFLVALKFAQYEIMKDICGTSPILLLDDLFDKLDSKRVANLLDAVSDEGFGQIFLSDTNRERICKAVGAKECRFFEAVGGTFRNE